ncbi:hypothetical protein GGE07_006575 [Sinorhizobium terangae]|nr:hypothetical protein [Sinorhizobium terangae]
MGAAGYRRRQKGLQNGATTLLTFNSSYEGAKIRRWGVPEVD